MDATKVIFSFRMSVFRDVRTDYNFELRFSVKKQISMTDLLWGHINIFRGDTSGLCFSWVYKRFLLARYAKIIICICLCDHSELTIVGRL